MIISSLAGRDVLALADLSPTEVALVLDTAAARKAAWAAGDHTAPLSGRAIALIFEKPSMRTRVSFEVACHRLGAFPVTLGGSDTVFSRGETVSDTTLVLERYCDAIVIRTFEHSKVEAIAATASVPVINSLTDDHHPCQGLADLLTIREHKGGLSGLTIAYVGDGNNMAHTYLQAGALTGMHVRIATPEGFEPASGVVEHASRLAEQNGGSVAVGRNPREAVDGADVVLTDTWASMGQEAEHAARASVFAPYRVDAALMREAASDAIFMHCLPAHRGEEVTDEVIDAPSSVVFDEAENRLHVQAALLELVLGTRA